MFVDDYAVYGGRTVDLRGKIEGILQGMARVEGFGGVVVMRRFEEAEGRARDSWRGLEGTMSWEQFGKAGSGNEKELRFERVGFSDPFLIVYSSGTTGKPKCLVHSVGGVVLNGWKEGALHRCLDENSVALQVCDRLHRRYGLLMPVCDVVHDNWLDHVSCRR